LYLRLNKKLLAAVLTVALASCGGGTLLKSFRIALASSAPLVNALVASGAIPQSKASAIIADFDAGAACGLTLQNELAAAQTRADKFAASSRALSCFRVIINRQNFAVNSRIQTVANIAEGILASLVAFYSDTTGASVKSEDQFEKELEVKVKALKEAMQP
jgi:hypothetical protein